ncbi:MAG: bifunctional phosphopantothenoylcysteine decarboxylase/phosphopantothenate--cysteine ligase CoaBC [Candidatus Gastranaerophilaceae bacterium]|jgi:phosphopantothenoylcysteine decarboxylase/phosphopantothenate--cysteine ligase
MSLYGKKILVGITGGIAAYKICDFVRLLKKQNADVTVVLTPSAKEFVTETTLRTLSQNQVYCEQFKIKEWKPEHINLADNADLFIIAPISANTIGKIAHGICDNLLTSLICAYKGRIVIAPAMNCNMWDNSFVQENIKKLVDKGFINLEPEEGFLACGYEGKGRMVSIESILAKAEEIIAQHQFLTGKKVIVTAGGTKEEIDPVRFIGNYSSGKMGIAIADEAFSAGAEVTLISTVKVEKPYSVKKVKSAQEMLVITKEEFENSDILFMAAAIADYRPTETAVSKIKKGENETLTLELVKNPDILKEISKIKKSDQVVIGFCAESENLINNANKKIQEKNLDFIAANDISNKEIGFNSDFNEITLIDKSLNQYLFEKDTKQNLAKKLLEKIFN